MPPKVAVRPAARVRVRPRGGSGPGARAKAGAGPKAKAGPGRRAAKRPAAEEAARPPVELGDKEISEAFEKGAPVKACRVPLYCWKAGQKVVGTDCSYWQEVTKVAGIIKGIDVEGDQVTLKVSLEGAQSEGLVRWVGQNPGKVVEIHLCLEGCALLCKDGLIHCRMVKLLRSADREDWMENLLGMGEVEPGADELSRLRRRAQLEEGRETGEDQRPEKEAKRGVSTSSEESRRKRKKKKKQKKKKEKRGGEVSKAAVPKSLEAVFGGTGLDPSPSTRKTIKRKARRAARKKGNRGLNSSSSSGDSSAGSSSSPGDPGHLFGEEARVKAVWKKYPGVLTLNTTEFMQGAVVQQSGQPWQLDLSSIPPIFTQYYRLQLQGKMSGPMGREAQTLCFAQDLLVQGKVSAACDVLTQRLKALEQMAGGGHFSIAQRQELVPLETATLSAPSEMMEAARLQREEGKAKSAVSRSWDRRNDWEKKNDDSKGKGKGKDYKGKGKTKSEGFPQNAGGRDEGKTKK